MKKIILFLLILFISKNYSQNNFITQDYIPGGISSLSSQLNNEKANNIKLSSKELNLSLNEAISMALEQNKDVLVSNEDLKKSEAQINEAYGNAYPTLNFEAQYVRNIKKQALFLPGNSPFNPDPTPIKLELGTDNNYSASLTLTQVLFSAKVNTAISIAKEYSHYTEHNAQSVRQDAVQNVKKAYYGVLFTKKIIEVTRQGLELAKATYENLQKLYKEGMASEFDLLRAEVQVANTEPRLSQSENNYVLAKNALRNVLGLDINQEINLTDDLKLDEVPLNVVEEESQQSLQRNSLLLGLQAYELILDKNITIQKSDNYPTLAAFGNYQYQTQDDGFKFNQYNTLNTAMVGVTLTYNIFNGLQTKYRIEQAIIEKDKTTLNRKKLEDGIKIQVDEAKLRMLEAKKRVDAQARSVEQATKAVSIAEVRFKNGLGTQLELIDSQVALTSTQINKAQAVYDYLVARADWERASGYNQL
ncbi:MAG: TolC family protein [Ignavibacteriales bacterium]|nr:TolC family protein [Ignavibacteriales bacterium]